MNEKVGEVFSIAVDNAPVPGCTISKEVYSGANYITYYSLAKDTDISAEIYPYHKFLIVAKGSIEVYGKEIESRTVKQNECIITPADTTVGVRTSEGAVYTEISVRRNDTMNEAVKAGEVFKLADLVPYQDGKIVNMDVVSNDTMKFVLMAFDKGTGLPEHAAPGEAIIFALDGEGVVGYEGQEHAIKAGENFHFAKGGSHYVKAVDGKFKMALLLTLD